MNIRRTASEDDDISVTTVLQRYLKTDSSKVPKKELFRPRNENTTAFVVLPTFPTKKPLNEFAFRSRNGTTRSNVNTGDLDYQQELEEEVFKLDTESNELTFRCHSKEEPEIRDNIENEDLAYEEIVGKEIVELTYQEDVEEIVDEVHDTVVADEVDDEETYEQECATEIAYEDHEVAVVEESPVVYEEVTNEDIAEEPTEEREALEEETYEEIVEVEEIQEEQLEVVREQFEEIREEFNEEVIVEEVDEVEGDDEQIEEVQEEFCEQIEEVQEDVYGQIEELQEEMINARDVEDQKHDRDVDEIEASEETPCEYESRDVEESRDMDYDTPINPVTSCDCDERTTNSGSYVDDSSCKENVQEQSQQRTGAFGGITLSEYIQMRNARDNSDEMSVISFGVSKLRSTESDLYKRILEIQGRRKVNQCDAIDE